MNIYILYTGGTIGSINTATGLVPMAGHDFSDNFKKNFEPIIKHNFGGISFDCEGFDQPLDSTNMQPSQWVDISIKIIEKYNAYDGFLILHGTDTMAYTSSALSFLLPKITKPVIVTGSQLPLFKDVAGNENSAQTSLELYYNTDAVRNLLGSIAFLTRGVPEVCLFFADRLLRGNRAVKSNANGFVAFESPNYPVLGEYGIAPILNEYLLLPIPISSSLSTNSYKNLEKFKEGLLSIKDNINTWSVIPFLIFPAHFSDPLDGESLLVSMLRQLLIVKPKIKGIILNSYGAGNVPNYESMKELMRKMNKKKIVIVDCTQVFSGSVNNDTYATGSWLKGLVTSGNDITPTAALAKLVILLAQNPKGRYDTIRNSMGSVLAGEMKNNYSLLVHQNAFLMPGECLRSINGKYIFKNEIDGKLRHYDISDGTEKEIWSNDCQVPGRLIMQADCSLVFYDKDFNVRCRFEGHAGRTGYFAVENDGSLCIKDVINDYILKTIYSYKKRNKFIYNANETPRNE